jgi:hypothetical protein
MVDTWMPELVEACSSGGVRFEDKDRVVIADCVESRFFKNIGAAKK